MKRPTPPANLALFLGGHDLEMITIAALGRRVLGEGRVHDKGLRWGALARAYEAEIRAALAGGLAPVLVELKGPLPDGVSRAAIIDVDHHDDRAGEPCSLEQVFGLLRRPQSEWTRDFALISANDTGHMAAMRAMGAAPDEIRRIRGGDRTAQGVTPEDERLARAALASARRRGALLMVESKTARTSPILDFLEPEYGGAGAGDVVVTTPETVEFYGNGAVVMGMAARYPAPESWSGGALPARGFWGRTCSGEDAGRARAEIAALAA